MTTKGEDHDGIVRRRFLFNQSIKTRRACTERQTSDYPPRWTGSLAKSAPVALGISSTVKVAVISSVISSIVTVTLFSFIMQPASVPLANATGNGGNGGNLQAAQTADPYDRIIQAAAKVRPSVVSIVNHKTGSSLSMDDSALGSGVIFKKEDGKAYIMTNHHVVEGASDLEIVTVEGETHKAKLVGKDRVSDIAVMSVEDDKGIGPVAEIGDSSKLQRGQTVLAIGNPLGLGGTLTSGIVSYTDRILPVSINQDGVYDWEQNVIQTDAAINEGNSGGALVDLNGKVVGINTMKISDTGVEGLGFAIPMNEVMKTVDSLLLSGKVSRPYLGVYTVDLSNPYAPLDDEQRKDLKLPSHVDSGVVVLEASGPASEAGLKLNDVITEFDGQKLPPRWIFVNICTIRRRLAIPLKLPFIGTAMPRRFL